MGIANTIKDASDSEKLNAAIAGMDTVQVGISLVSSILSTALDICSSSPAARAYTLRPIAKAPMANPLTGLSIVATDATKLVKEVICSSVLVVFEPKILFKLSNTPIPAPIPGISFPPDLNFPL
jgi:hypothetical protein